MRMFRRLLLTVLTAALLLAPVPAVATDDTFTDDDGTTYEPAIETLADADVVEGCDDDNFCPTEAVRRDQAAALLARAFDLPAADRDYFDDDNANTHEDDINRLAAAGITKGCPGDDFCVDDTLERDQMASLLARALDLSETDDRYFTDVGGVHAGAVHSLAAAGVTAGCTTKAKRFCPDQHVLRGEMAVFLARALDLRPRADLAPIPEPEPAPATTPRDSVWDRLAECESGGNWSINTGNGYYGGLQFSLSSWRAVGGSGYPHTHSREEQIARGKKLQAIQGWGAWPACSRKLGLR